MLSQVVYMLVQFYDHNIYDQNKYRIRESFQK